MEFGNITKIRVPANDIFVPGRKISKYLLAADLEKLF